LEVTALRRYARSPLCRSNPSLTRATRYCKAFDAPLWCLSERPHGHSVTLERFINHCKNKARRLGTWREENRSPRIDYMNGSTVTFNFFGPTFRVPSDVPVNAAKQVPGTFLLALIVHVE
jgi:hypothetical protein